MTSYGVDVANLQVQFGADPVLDIPSLRIHAGGFVALTGPSGSGKTTLLHTLAGILKPRSGTVRWNEVIVSALGESASDRWRLRHCGLVFQDFHLIEQLSPIKNVLLPATFSSFVISAELKGRATTLLKGLGVPDAARSVTTLSRGERQRVAIARALLFNPPVVLADEPTASLDQAAAESVGGTLAGLAFEGRTVLVVTHDPALIARADHVIRLERGRIVERQVQAKPDAMTHATVTAGPL